MRLLPLALLLVASAWSFTVQAADQPPSFKRILPPPGIKIPDEDRARLAKAASELELDLAAVQWKLSSPKMMMMSEQMPLEDALADIEVFIKAVRYGLENEEFYDKKDIARADHLLATASARLKLLRDEGSTDGWARERQKPIALGFRSRLDDSVQPYGVILPEKLDESQPMPLYVWLHGRGDKMTDMAFIGGLKAPPINPSHAIILQPFGRYMNGFKFAGETDVMEAIAAVQRRFPIDDRRIVLCGFSMGGAGAWQLGAHYAGRWVAVSPGAGFAETARYQNLTPDKYPPWYEQTLWGLYDVPDYVLNLFNLPVIAYSGEVDKQIQAARVMEEAFQQEGHKLEHLIGPGMGHKYHPDVLKQLQARLEEFAAQSKPREPDLVSLQTRTLRYGQMEPLRLLALDEHWQDSRAVLDRQQNTLTTKNVAALSLVFRDKSRSPKLLMVDGQKVKLIDPSAVTLVRENGQWREVERLPFLDQLHKLPGLQGPIDDAFLEPFLVVTPTGKSANSKFERWMKDELAHFRDRWRRLFRGDLRIKRDTEIEDGDLHRYHVVLWGDCDSNRVLAKMKGRLPIEWDAKTITVNGQRYDASHHAPVLIYPNPLAPKKYVVLNSGFTFREGHDSSNSLQTPKLPDWAVVDLDTPPDAYAPGKIVAADFFDEQWQFRKQDGPGKPK